MSVKEARLEASRALEQGREGWLEVELHCARIPGGEVGSTGRKARTTPQSWRSQGTRGWVGNEAYTIPNDVGRPFPMRRRTSGSGSGRAPWLR